MDEQPPSKLLSFSLIAYLLLLCGAGTAFVIFYFPSHTKGDSTWLFPCRLATEQGFLLLAFASGVTGSFIHAAQSLSTYLGNREFKRSWASWYFLRPWIGGILGISIYVAFRAGLVSAADLVNPYGVVALALLGGWFSKTTSDKMQEVFETMFKTTEDQRRKDKLTPSDQPVIDSIDPSPVPAGQKELTINGKQFLQGLVVVIDGNEIVPVSVTDSQLRVDIGTLPARPVSGTVVTVQVKNPEGVEPISAASKLEFQ